MTHVDLQIVEFIQGELEVGSTVSIVEWEITKERKESEGWRLTERSGEAEREGQWSKQWKEWGADRKLDDRKRTEGLCLPPL